MRQTKAQIAAANEAAIKAEQQAELRRLRAEKAAATRAANKAAAHAQAVQPQSMHANIDAMVRDLLGDYALPPAGRVVVGLLLALGAAFGVGYGIGLVLNFTIAGIVALSAGAAYTLIMSVLAWALAFYSTWKLGGLVAGKVTSSFILDEGVGAKAYDSIALAASSTKHKVAGWFGAGKEKIAAQFSGAHIAQVAA